MFNLIEGPIDVHICALFQYTPFAPFGLFVSIDFCQIKSKSNIYLEFDSCVETNLCSKERNGEQEG